MKGIILAGGSGTRLYPLTKVTSKQLLPIYDKPMIYYPMSVLMNAGIRDILIISTPQDTPRFEDLLGDGHQFGVSLTYAVQPSPDGLAQAFIIGVDFIGDDTVAMVLGDNIFAGHGLKKRLKAAVKNAETGKGATVFGYYVDDPERFGIVEFNKNGKAVSIEEISKMPDCTLALLHGRVGEQCKADKAILDKICVFAFSSESVEQLKHDVDEAYNKLQIIDDQGNDMIYDKLDTNEILKWGGRHPEVEVRKLISDDVVSLDDIQKLISNAHSYNIKNGLIYATATQTIEKLRQKIGDGVCFIAEENGKLIGTATVCSKEINYWYYSGKVSLIKLVAVDSDSKHSRIGTRLIEACIRQAVENEVKVVVTDSAEENIIFKKLAKRCGFKVIDYCKYKANNFISTVYALFIDRELSPSDVEIEKHLAWKHEHIIEKE